MCIVVVGRSLKRSLKVLNSKVTEEGLQWFIVCLMITFKLPVSVWHVGSQRTCGGQDHCSKDHCLGRGKMHTSNTFLAIMDSMGQHKGMVD